MDEVSDIIIAPFCAAWSSFSRQPREGNPQESEPGCPAHPYWSVVYVILRAMPSW